MNNNFDAEIAQALLGYMSPQKVLKSGNPTAINAATTQAQQLDPKMRLGFKGDMQNMQNMHTPTTAQQTMNAMTAAPVGTISTIGDMQAPDAQAVASGPHSLDEYEMIRQMMSKLGQRDGIYDGK